MWNIYMPDISVLYKYDPTEDIYDFLSDKAKADLEKNKILPEEKMLKDMITTAHNTNVSYEEYLKLPEIDDLLWKYPEYEPIMYACYQCEHYDFGRRTGETKNGTLKEQRTGLIAQTIMADYLGQPRPRGSEEGFDKGIDFQINGANVDIKCMGRTCPIEHQWVHNLLESQHHNSQSETDYYIFCSLDKKESVLQICGYVQKKLVDRCAELHKKGEEVKNDFGHIIKLKADTFMIKQDVLYPICSPNEINKGINKEHLVKSDVEAVAKACVKFFGILEKAKTDPQTQEGLENYEKNRFAKINKRSTYNLMASDYFPGEQQSLEYQLRKADAKHKLYNHKYVCGEKEREENKAKWNSFNR